MVFRYYTNAVSQASRTIASGILIVGFLLIGFGVLIAALPKIFAYLAAGMFFVAGAGCAITAARIFWSQSRLDKSTPTNPPAYRKNVRVRVEEYHDQ